MTRRAIAVTTYGQRVTCDRCGVALYVSRRAVDGWLRGKGWQIGNDKDLCPGCAETQKVRIDYSGEM